MAYQNQIDRFDRDRGDVLSLAREDVARLADYWEYSHPVLHSLFSWFLGADEASVQMQDPRDNRELRGLIEHQKKNAARRYDYLVAQRERKLGKTKTTDNHGQPRTQVEDKDKPKNSVSVNSSALSGGYAAPIDGDSTPTASPSSAIIGKDDVIEARSTVARYAPEPQFVLAFDPMSNGKVKDLYADCAKCCSIKDREKCKAMGAKGKAYNPECGNMDGDETFVDKRALDASDALRSNGDKILSFRLFWRHYSRWVYEYNWLKDESGSMWDEIFTLIGEQFNDQTSNALLKYRDTLGKQFAYALWTFRIQRNAGQLPDKDKDGNPTNYGKLLFGRLKKLVAAKAILAQVDETRQRPPAQ